MSEIYRDRETLAATISRWMMGGTVDSTNHRLVAWR